MAKDFGKGGLPETRGLLRELFKITSRLGEIDGEHEDVDKVSAELSVALRSLERAASLTERRSRPRPEPGGHVLSERERAIAECLAAGHSYKDIAVAFGLTVASAQSRVRGIYLKLGIHSKREVRSLFARGGK